nr:transposase [Micromonospora andamanensis]
MAPPKVRQITGWLLRRPDSLDTDEQLKLRDIRGRCAHLNALAGHVTAFAEMLTGRHGERLDAWIAAVEADDQHDLQSFAAGLKRDYDAVRNGLTLPYSSGTVEGNVNKIKMLKRQMFGRAKLDLLRKRVLLAPVSRVGAARDQSRSTKVGQIQIQFSAAAVNKSSGEQGTVAPVLALVVEQGTVLGGQIGRRREQQSTQRTFKQWSRASLGPTRSRRIVFSTGSGNGVTSRCRHPSGQGAAGTSSSTGGPPLGSRRRHCSHQWVTTRCHTLGEGLARADGTEPYDVSLDSVAGHRLLQDVVRRYMTDDVRR